MKVNETNNDRMVLCAVINIAVSLAITSQNIFSFSIPNWLKLILTVANFLCDVFLLWYLVSALQLANQKQSVLTPFYMLLGISVLTGFAEFFTTKSVSTFNLLNPIIILYAFIWSFSITDKFLALPVKLFVGSLALKIVAVYFLISHYAIGPISPLLFAEILGLLSAFSMLFIVLRTDKLRQSLVAHNENITPITSADTESTH